MNLMGIEVPDWKYRDMKAAGWTDNEIYLNVQGSGQMGSQFWMNSGYTAPEPDVATKAAFSSADYARDWIGGYAAVLEAIGVKVSPGAAAIADYPISPASAAIWQEYPAVGPVQAAVVRYGEDLIQQAGTAVSNAVEPRTGGDGSGGGGAGPAAGLPEIPSWLLPVGLALAAAFILPSLFRGGAANG